MFKKNLDFLSFSIMNILLKAYYFIEKVSCFLNCQFDIGKRIGKDDFSIQVIREMLVNLL